ncbi:hypothetical protein HPB50_021490 [Hyalomma asiaticum]|uniref:Uncharacterized protein n=1 Tax=Hyalomma asiaticum TaxID=266040 RepID=A0ACB7SKA5_HYAAI|nr:hypothetical protein HPB50_021490 [Hyalomma asiaticum]
MAHRPPEQRLSDDRLFWTMFTAMQSKLHDQRMKQATIVQAIRNLERERECADQRRRRLMLGAALLVARERQIRMAPRKKLQARCTHSQSGFEEENANSATLQERHPIVRSATTSTTWTLTSHTRGFVAYRFDRTFLFMHSLGLPFDLRISKVFLDIIAAPLNNAPYQRLKQNILDRTTTSESARIRHLLTSLELGDRSPSQLLNSMRQLLRSSDIDSNGTLFRELFLQRLPPSTRLVLAAAGELTLDRLAQLANRVHDATSATVTALSPTPKSSIVSRLQSRIDQITASINALRTSPHDQRGVSTRQAPGANAALAHVNMLLSLMDDTRLSLPEKVVALYVKLLAKYRGIGRNEVFVI